MPIYECLCRACDTRSSILVPSPLSCVEARCQHCGSSNVDRLLSRFAAPKSEEVRLESLLDLDNLGGLDENDPRCVARLMKRMGEETGEDVGDDVEAIEAIMDQAEDEEGTMPRNDGV